MIFSSRALLFPGRIGGACVTFTTLLNDCPSEDLKSKGLLGKLEVISPVLQCVVSAVSSKKAAESSKSHSRVGLKSSTKQKTTIFSTLASEKSLSDCKKEQQWKLSMYNSITPVCFTSPLIEKPIGKTYRKNVQQMIQCLIRKLATLSQYEEVLAKISSTSTDRLTVLKTKPQSIQRDIITVCSDPYTLAQQLTHIELERLHYIGPEEFVQAFVQKDPLDNDKSCYSERKKTRNLEAYVEWFNRLSYLVATEICMPVKKKHRARMIEYFIDVARECFNIGNFNSLMAIISGMNMSPVSRLKKTWAKVKTAKFDVLEHQMDPSSNFYNYRTALRGAAQRSLTAHSSREKIVIPFFSLLIKDIYFLNEGCANRLPNGHVNFEKFWELAKQVSEFMTWKQVECPFERDRKILQYLLTVPVFSEDALYLASYESEGPENHIEKDRWKSLRSSLLGRV
uniref:ras-GEF domain-containing family member 1B isoform X4 n=1 Tax=Halichoerus grypus TaxID=9711 RepID=UPI00165A06C5|nr:ras-GEF domain-containing family member 1B isoform X4 [Halichoerus grypus]